ncbi:hypothetical protein CONPUDRAFT_46727 [Coniophora puteana RWD-64-598 SS2]|uniref:SNF2 family DNA-dependent ATPase n=1 Tax=Coniophora puteana (strain RWD-64-598) TaxID=741705 RepID=A0A5M3N629_CONPW|nr:uncharacterized protein CONPUDRAFT_46727 [Coniophora puteana RWD-64-598 SS2]EIW86879.1 hypothetical protein CONPUDRAFT_46727 [Coniophora puteana RWD-64-598 SS2]
MPSGPSPYLHPSSPSPFATRTVEQSYRPAFAGPPSPFHKPPQVNHPIHPASLPPLTPSGPSGTPSASQVIDLTGSPSPPPSQSRNLPHTAYAGLPADLAPKTPVCIGQLQVTALVLYPVPYIKPQDHSSVEDWASVRLQYEHNPQKTGSSETIHIRPPPIKASTGEVLQGEDFAVVEQKVATSLGPMLGKGLIRLDAKVRRIRNDTHFSTLQALVYTPKGNITVVGNYLRQCGLLLDHPSYPFDLQRLSNIPSHHYFNPHSPPPGGHRAAQALGRPNPAPGIPGGSRWGAPAVSGKTLEIQRSQVEELFKSMKSGDELPETVPPSHVCTPLYPHQKKALSFLLERERETRCPDGTNSSLWQFRMHPLSGHASWFHIVTQKEVFEEPLESKGAILADDMGLGKTITCVSLIAATLGSAWAFGAEPVEYPTPLLETGVLEASLNAAHFSGSVWGMPDVSEPTSNKGKAKALKAQEKAEAEYARARRIKTRSRATLIICPLSTVANWEDQFKEHWKGDVVVVGGGGLSCAAVAGPASNTLSTPPSSQTDVKVEAGPSNPLLETDSKQSALRIYVYHGNARCPDVSFLANFDAVITTYATLASEFSKQSRCIANAEAEEDEDGSSDGPDADEHGSQTIRIGKPKRAGMKRKKSVQNFGAVCEATSPLQMINWFRVVLDEAHCIKETGTVGCRACCDLMADRRLCLTGTPVQNKLDDIFALIKFLRLQPFDDKNVWTEYIATPVKYGQSLGVARLQTIMARITLRRTKETRDQDGKKILNIPPRRDELRYLKFDEQEQKIYDQFFNESKAEFNELSNKNEVMKNYVGILQKILRLRQICDHFELVEGKDGSDDPLHALGSYEEIAEAIAKEGINLVRATAIFALLREASTTQCVECGEELCCAPDTHGLNGDMLDCERPPAAKRGRKAKGTASSGPSSRGPTRANSPSAPQPVLTRCQHLFCAPCFRACICPGWPDVPPETRRQCSVCQTALGPLDAVQFKRDASPLDFLPKKKTVGKREKRIKGIMPEDFHPSTKVKALLEDLIQFSRANPHSANYDPEGIEVQMVDVQGNKLDDGVVKTVVFSQWTTMLDKVEDALETARIRYDRLDGTMKREERSRAMDALKKDPACEVLLVSLRAGGVGLNLTAAQRVYLMDPYWNPAVENQAVDRIHRLGQTRPVTTVKLIIENSIEDRLLEVQRKKTELANMTLGQNFSKADMLQRRMEELNQLFGS